MKPKIIEQIDGYEFSWVDQHISIKVNRLTLHKDGRVIGELIIRTDAKGYSPILMPSTQLNFSAERTRTSLIKNLTEKFPLFKWGMIIDELAHYVQEFARQGEPVKELWTHDEVKPPEFLLDPILIKGMPTVIFGEKGVTKSTLALTFYVCLTLPWHDNPLELKAPLRSVKTLILDWETESDIMQYYAKKLQTGMNLQTFPLLYRRCALPLADDLEQIQKHQADTKAEVLIIDSLGAAAGGDLKKPEQALNFFSSLRRLKTTSLIIAQTSKDEETKKKRIYGSVYFEYYARNIFELCKSETLNEDEIDIALFHRWSNLTKLAKPMGFCLHYNDLGLSIERASVNLSEFGARVSTRQRLLELLKSGAKSTSEIMDELDIKGENARLTLKRLKDKNLIVKVGDKWGLMANEGE